MLKVFQIESCLSDSLQENYFDCSVDLCYTG